MRRVLLVGMLLLGCGWSGAGQPLPEPILLSPGDTFAGDGARTVVRRPIVVRGGLTPSPGRGIPDRTLLQDFTLDCEGTGINTGIFVDAANVKIDRVTVRGCHHGIVVHQTVNSVIRDSLIVHNVYGVWVTPSGIVTTLTFSGNNIRESGSVGMVVHSGNGIRLVDQNIIEANTQIGLLIQDLRGPSGLTPVISQGTWFEANPTAVVGEEWLKRIE